MNAKKKEKMKKILTNTKKTVTGNNVLTVKSFN